MQALRHRWGWFRFWRGLRGDLGWLGNRCPVPGQIRLDILFGYTPAAARAFDGGQVEVVFSHHARDYRRDMAGLSLVALMPVTGDMRRLVIIPRMLIGFADHRQHRPGGDGLPLAYINLQQHAAGRGWNLGVHFVRADFQQRLILADCVALLLQPFADRSLDHTLAKLRHDDFAFHKALSCLTVSSKGDTCVALTK